MAYGSVNCIVKFKDVQNWCLFCSMCFNLFNCTVHRSTSFIIHNHHSGISLHVVYVLVSQMNAKIWIFIISKLNHRNSIRMYQILVMKVLQLNQSGHTHTHTKQEHTSSIVSQWDKKCNVCTHRPTRTKYLIDNKHWRDWCEAESVRADGWKRKKRIKRGRWRGRVMEQKKRYSTQSTRTDLDSAPPLIEVWRSARAWSENTALILHIRARPCL